MKLSERLRSEMPNPNEWDRILSPRGKFLRFVDYALVAEIEQLERDAEPMRCKTKDWPVDSKLKSQIDFGGDIVFTERDRCVIREAFKSLCEQLRPKETIGACPGGDPTYVWEAMAQNALRKALGDT